MSQDRSGGRPDRRGSRPGASRRNSGRSGGSANATGGAGARREDRGRRPDAERTSGQRLTPKTPRRPEPAIADGVTGKELDRSVWTQLRTLSKENAEGVAQHLVMVALLLDTDLDAAQAHAETAVRRAGRVPAAREALGLVAYRQGDWAKALAEFRTVRRLSGSSHLLPLMVDTERALGRPDRALELATTPEARTLARDERVELAIVVSGIRRDQGQLDAALAGLRIPELDPSRRKPWSARLFYAYADALLALGDRPGAREWFGYAVDADETLETDAAERVEELDGIQQIDLLENEHPDEPSHRG
jgi:tetratricopeptide (TPR) repeat protein